MALMNQLFRLSKVLFLFVFMSLSDGLMAQGQGLEIDFYSVLQKSERLENSENFEAAYQKWSDLQAGDLSRDQKAQRAFKMAYLGLVAGYKEAPGAMRRFVRDYPSAPEVNRAYTTVGQYYFSKGQYANALAWYREAEVATALTEQHQFEMGYAYFKLGNYKESAGIFEHLESSEFYGPKSLYYTAFIDYKKQNWEAALARLERIVHAERDDLEVWGLMSDIAFRIEDYQHAVTWGIRALDALQIKGGKRNANQSSILGLVGRAYAHMEAHPLAIEYLEKAVAVSNRQRDNAEHIENQYYLGRSYVVVGQHKNAVSLLTDIQSDELLSKEIAYVLAGAYLSLDQKTEALNAYKKACDTQNLRPFSAQAFFQYAKLTYELKLSYTSVPEVLGAFITAYPNHPERAQVEQWWFNTLLERNNYDRVIAYLNDGQLSAVEFLNNNRTIALQRAYFLKGRQQYNEGLSSQAQISFDKARTVDPNTLIGGQALFWSGTIDSETGMYQKSLEKYDQLSTITAFNQTPEWTAMFFEQGYAHMALRNYFSAQQGFLRYLNQKKPLLKEYEARLNLADCYFASKAYAQALFEYDKVYALGGAEKDYADFQAAKCLEFTQNLEAKVDRLVGFLSAHPNSVYRDEVYSILGNAYVNLNKISEANHQYKTLISEQGQSPLVASAYLNLGLIADNNGEFEVALTYFKSVVDLFPGTQEAISAVQSARNTFISLGRVAQYKIWVDELEFITIDQAVLDQASFESAKQAYLAGEDTLAVDRFNSYLNSYDQGRFTAQAHYFLSEIFWRQQAFDQALMQAQWVIEAAENPTYVIATLIRVARYYLSIQDTTQAELALNSLLENDIDFDQRTFVLSNLLHIASDNSKWHEAVSLSEQLSSHLSGQENNVLLTEARLMGAWSYFELKDFESARELYRGMEGQTTDRYRPQFILAQAFFAHLDENYLYSNELIQKLAQNHANYPEYGARGLLLMAENFSALSDPFQAQFILENIRDNMIDFPELQESARVRLAQMNQANIPLGDQVSYKNESESNTVNKQNE